LYFPFVDMQRHRLGPLPINSILMQLAAFIPAARQNIRRPFYLLFVFCDGDFLLGATTSPSRIRRTTV
jgi:hypothetical protein